MDPTQLKAMTQMGTNKQAPEDPIQAMVKMGITPDQASAVLGHSNSLMMGGLAGGIQSTTKALAAGGAKGVISTLGTIGTGLEKGLDAAANLIPGVHAKTAQDSAVTTKNPALQPQGTAESIGYTGEKVGEFFTPGGIEKGAAEKAAPFLDKLPDLIGMTGKAANTVTKTLKSALQGLIGGTSMGTVTAAQTGDMNKAKGAAEFGVGAGMLTGITSMFGPQVSEMLHKADFKLSPQMAAKTQKITDAAASFLTKHTILGSDAAKHSKLKAITSGFESALQNSLPKDVSVDTKMVVDDMKAQVESLKTEDPAVYQQAKNKVDEAAGIIADKPGMSIQDILKGKRSWGSMAFKTSQKGKADPTVSNEGALIAEQAYQNALQGTLNTRGIFMGEKGSNIQLPATVQKYFDGAKSVSFDDFNKVYSDAINAKNLTGMAQFRNDSGLFGRMFGLWVGKSIGQTVMPGLAGEIIGGGLGEMASRHVPGFARSRLEEGLANPELPLDAAKATQGVLNQNP